MTSEHSLKPAIIPPVTDRKAYLHYINSTTLEKVGFINNPLSHGVKKKMMRRLTNFMGYVDQSMPSIEEETEEQRTRRLGWIRQAKAIELLNEYGFKNDPQRLEWKRKLVSEILKARQENDPPFLPGVEVYFREPYQDYLDNFSGNRVVIKFKGNEKERGFHVGTTISNLVAEVGDMEPALGLLKEYSAMPENTAIWLVNFLDEIVRLRGIIVDNVDVFQQIKKRFDLIMQLTLSDNNAREKLEVKYRVERDRYHTFFLSVKRNLDTNEDYSTSVQIQANYVTDTFWDFLKSLSDDGDTIPTREESSLKRNKPQKVDTVADEEDDEWGGRRPKFKKKSSRRDNRLDED